MYKFSILLLLLALLPAHAGYGAIPTVCSAYESTPLIFRARVLQITPVPPPSQATEVTYPDGTKTTLYVGYPGGPMDHVRLQVLEVFKGNPGSEITVLGSNQLFSKDGDFLVYAEPNVQDELVANIRARTGPISSPYVAADLAWLRAYPTAPPTARIFGDVGMGYGVTDIPPITINLSGEKSLTATTDAAHSYAFNGLPPGSYTLTAAVPAGYTTLAKNTMTVTVAAKGCAEVDWAIRHDTHIKGRVTDTAGNAAPHIAVSLLNADPNRPGSILLDIHRTDVDGNYDFSKLDPGDYYVALDYLGPNNNDPYTPVYYTTGTDNSNISKTIHLGPSESKENINLVRTPPLHPVSIHLHVINPDGTPVIKAHIAAMDPLTPHQFIGSTADADGNADITLYEGRTYSLEADTSGYREPGCAGPVKFIAKEGLQLGTMTLDKSIQECRALEKRN